MHHMVTICASSKKGNVKRPRKAKSWPKSRMRMEDQDINEKSSWPRMLIDGRIGTTLAQYTFSFQSLESKS